VRFIRFGFVLRNEFASRVYEYEETTRCFRSSFVPQYQSAGVVPYGEAAIPPTKCHCDIVPRSLEEPLISRRGNLMPSFHRDIIPVLWGYHPRSLGKFRLVSQTPSPNTKYMSRAQPRDLGTSRGGFKPPSAVSAPQGAEEAGWGGLGLPRMTDLPNPVIFFSFFVPFVFNSFLALITRILRLARKV